jgi:hypothetical protein
MMKVCRRFVDFKERELIKPGRRFVYEGELSKICRKDRQRRSFFLFSDVLVYAYPATVPGKFRVGREFRLFSMKTKDLPDSKLKKMINAFQITSESKSFIVLADTPEKKKEWLDTIAKSQEEDKLRSETLRNKEEVSGTDAPVWVPDAEAKSCSLCTGKFTFTNRRHHCRQCGNVVCGPCSDQKKVLPGQGKVKVCTECLNRPVEATEGDAAIVAVDGSNSDSLSDADVIFELTALYDYVPPQTTTGSQKLKFNKGDILCILQVDDSGWWLGELNGEKGWVPASFLEQPPQDA